MKYIIKMFAVMAVLLTSLTANAVSYEKNAPFQIIKYYKSSSGTGDLSGADYNNALPMVDGDMFGIPAGAIIDRVYFIVDEEITGTSALTVGDDDSATGFKTGIQALTAGMYNYQTPSSGAYLAQGAKYYSAAGKEVKLDFTGANTGGKLRVIVEGYLLKE